MPDIQDMLPLKQGGMVSIIGAGGKTSLMFHLAAVLAGTGRKVLTTTTTKIFKPLPEQSKTVILSDSMEELLDKSAFHLTKVHHVTAAASQIKETGKLKGFSSEIIHKLYTEKLFDWILVEADGAAQRSLKVPSDHEPVIPDKSDMVIGVAGLDVIGKPLNESSVFRAELFSRKTGLPLGESIRESHLAALIAHPDGMFKGAPAGAGCLLFLNKADNKKSLDSGNKIVEQLSEGGPGRPQCVIIGQARGRLTIHECHCF